MIAIDVAERISASGERLPFALEIVGFGDEEGSRFGATLLGSGALAGTWDPTWWPRTDADGVHLKTAGLVPSFSGLGHIRCHSTIGQHGIKMSDLGLSELGRESGEGWEKRRRGREKE